MIDLPKKQVFIWGKKLITLYGVEKKKSLIFEFQKLGIVSVYSVMEFYN